MFTPGVPFSLDPSVAHLNHGSFGAVPVPVQRAQQLLREEVEANPDAFFGRGLVDRIGAARRRVAAFLGADPDGTALVANATAGVAVALGSLRLGSGDEILLTDHAYGAVRLAAHDACRRPGAAVREVSVPLDATDDEIVAIIAAAAETSTRLAIVDQLASSTARLFPVAALTAALHAKGVPVLVDGAHAPGALAPPVPQTDYWVGNLHKWAYAPRPTAALVVTSERRASIRPAVVSWRQEEGFPESVEFAGTLDYTAWLTAPAALDLLESLGADAVRAHNAALADYGQAVVAEALGVRQLKGGPVPMRVVPLPPGSVTDRETAHALRARIAAELHCEVNVGLWRDVPLLRLSAQIYNRRAEYERLAQGLPRIL